MSEELFDENEDLENGATDEEDPIESAFLDSVENDLNEDATMLAMIQAGAKIKNVAALYKRLAVEHKIIATQQEKQEIVESAFCNLEMSTEEGFNSAIESLTNLPGVDNRSASMIISHFARKNNMTDAVWRKPTGTSRQRFTVAYHSFLLDNPTRPQSEVEVYLNTCSENIIKNIDTHLGIAKLVRDVAAKYTQSEAA